MQCRNMFVTLEVKQTLAIGNRVAVYNHQLYFSLERALKSRPDVKLSTMYNHM